MSQKFRRRTLLLTGLSLGLALLIILNSTLFFTRIDLTETGAYSISAVSRELFREIDDRVHIDYYLSDRLRSRAAEVEQIADLLYQYAAFSRGKIGVNVIDPAAAEITQQVESAGVLPRQIQVIEQDQQSLAVVYSGIVISYLDRTEVLPFVIEPASIEYQLTSAIKALLADMSTRIAILVGDERRTLAQNYGQIQSQLMQRYEIVQVFPGERIPADSAALVVLGATALDKDELYPLDQYLMKDGRIFLAVDAINVNVDLSFFAYAVGALPIFDLLAHYGVEIAQYLVADSFNLRVPTQQQSEGEIVIQRLVSYPYWITVLGASVNAEHPLTSRFSGLDIFWASPITIIDNTPGRITPLLYSSPESWLITDQPFNTDPSQALVVEFLGSQAERTEYLLGTIINGAFESYFSEAPEQYREAEISHLPATPEGRLILISDSDFIGPVAQFTQSTHNYTFFENAVGYLVNDEELIAIQTRANRDVRLNAIPDPERRLTITSRAILVNVVIIPLAVAIFGIVRFLRRRKMIAPSLAQPSKSSNSSPSSSRSATRRASSGDRG